MASIMREILLVQSVTKRKEKKSRSSIDKSVNRSTDQVDTSADFQATWGLCYIMEEKSVNNQDFDFRPPQSPLATK